MRMPRGKQVAAIAGTTTVVALASYLLVVAHELHEAASGLGRTLDREARSPAVRPVAPTAPPITGAVETDAEPTPGALGDTASEIDSAPPVAPEHAAAPAAPPQGTQLPAEHLPAAVPVRGQGDAALYAQSLETLLADDPESLQAVRELLRERDPVRRNANLELLRDSFGIE